ncbi:RNA polymerase sigma factor [Bacillus sp. BRMEA1]|uniref:RNA polymerase sigma factor n=1 Tax=Neobacillus endophyticus TaxID=2738405 RepID=UPI0015674FCE|nr:RNA polymerase sigma factor [Neobacillus endophyticus]NRD80116.1 RNA polymerase sigma factor [Neobacillus endophyticus]
MGETYAMLLQYESNHTKEKSLETLIANHGVSLRKFAFRFVRDWIVVDDIMQEVYLKAFLKVNTLMDGSSIKSWLFTVTANQCKDYLRLKYVKNTILTDNFETTPLQMVEFVEKKVIEQFDLLQLQKVINTLPNQYREPLVMRYYDHLSYMEISDILNLGIQTIKTRIHRAKKLIKRKLY